MNNDPNFFLVLLRPFLPVSCSWVLTPEAEEFLLNDADADISYCPDFN